MNIVLFYHSLLSDWNHGNAHFLRGIAWELISRGHAVTIYEPENSWSLSNLVSDYGKQAIADYQTYYPGLNSVQYDESIYSKLDKKLEDADLVIVHEWNDHELVSAIGDVKKRSGFRLLFHDTHHRAVTEIEKMSAYDLSNYDGVLAYGEVISKIYLQQGWAKKAWTWHEAADTRLFHPLPTDGYEGDVAWIGNWGDDERTKELHEYLIEPVAALKLKCTIYGVRYPKEAIRDLEKAGIEYKGWLPNYKVPETFARHKLTVHVPRRPYVQSLPGIPTIRPFEAMACGIPMISSPWNDEEHLFRTGTDFLMVSSGEEMKDAMKELLGNDRLADQFRRNGLETIFNRHTCAHRVNELMSICTELDIPDYSTQRLTT